MKRSKRVDAAAQMNRVKLALGEVLGQTQELKNDVLNLDEISACLAMAMREVFAAQSGDFETAQTLVHVNRAMDRLRRTLVLLQDAEMHDPNLAGITGNTARILALLYPVSTEIGRVVSPHPKPDSIIPLVQKLPSRPVSPAPGVERREQSRHRVDVEIGLFSNSNFFTGFAEDISYGGIFVATYDVLPIGSQLNVNFSLPHGPVMSLDGTVRWVRECSEPNSDLAPGMGVRFDGLMASDREAINDFIAQNPPIFFDDD